jgi:hypothetical protein
MRTVRRFDQAAAMPSRHQVMSLQGIPMGAELPQRVTILLEQAYTLYAQLTEPIGVREQITAEQFAEVYEGEGRNADPAPLAEIFPLADRLDLFAVTVGATVCAEIKRLFTVNDPALGYMLDSVASAATDLLSMSMARDLQAEVGTDLTPILPYSPGYCGWNISGQAKLFAALKPEEIGISLNSSYLMQPLKSVSGVLVAAGCEVHELNSGTYAFCAECRNQSCHERIDSVMMEPNLSSLAGRQVRAQ